MKIVIDTNILINASADESSYAFRIVKEVIVGRLEAFATHQTMSENRQMLQKLVKDKEYKTLLEDFFRKLKIVKFHSAPFTPSLQKRGLGELLSDQEDVKLLESAFASGADYLITNDRELLDVEQLNTTKIVIPQDFWNVYKNNDNDSNSAWGDWTKMLLGN